MITKLRRAWRTGLVLAYVYALSLFGMAAAVGFRFFVGVLIGCSAGFLVTMALHVYAQTVRIERRAAAARERAAELEQLERELLDAPDEPARVRVLERLCKLEILPVLALALLVGCAGNAHEPGELEGCTPELPAVDLFLTLSAEECAGWQVDGTTPFIGHPDTGVCSFSCKGPRQVHLCAALGGRCQPASDGARYCEAP